MKIPDESGVARTVKQPKVKFKAGADLAGKVINLSDGN
jgi:hypothetical protein